MGCQATKCKNCKKSIKACERRLAMDGTSCCKNCVEAKNKTL